jgi:hypothetical protein
MRPRYVEADREPTDRGRIVSESSHVECQALLALPSGSPWKTRYGIVTRECQALRIGPHVL